MPRAMASEGPAIWISLAVHQDPAFVRARQPVQDVHQGGLAGAVLAQQGVDLAPTHVEVDVVVGHHPGVSLRDPPHLESWGASACGVLGHGFLDGLRPARCSERAAP